MKLLVLEQNKLISDIYKKIFDEKKYYADYAKSESDFIDKFDENYDYVVLEHLKSKLIEGKIRRIKPSQKIISLEPFMKSDVPLELKKAQELIDKPFAILTSFAKLEIEKTNQYV